MRKTVLLLASMALAVLVACGVAMVEAPRPAQAAFPGTNGKIVFQSDRTTGTGVDNPTGDLEIFSMNSNGTGVTQLTHNTVGDGTPAFSSDGEQIAFSSCEDGNCDIFKMNADGTERTRLTTDPFSDSDPSWSPDGEQIVFSRVHDDGVELVCCHLIIVNADGTESTPVESGREAAWSPDGRYIAYTYCDSISCTKQDVYRVEPDGTGRTLLTKGSTFFFESSPAWSPSGKRIAFVRNGDIYVMRPDGSGKRALTDNRRALRAPAWSPDGTKIAFSRFVGTRESGFNFEVFKMKADGSGKTNITNHAESDDLTPDWQPIPGG